MSEDTAHLGRPSLSRFHTRGSCRIRAANGGVGGLEADVLLKGGGRDEAGAGGKKNRFNTVLQAIVSS